MSTTVLSASRLDAYQAVTDTIIQAIMAGADEFHMPWHSRSGPVIQPTNAATGAGYRGVNVLILWAEAQLRGYRSGYWATYDQWRGVGGQVRRGERSATAIVYEPVDVPEIANDEAEPRGYARATPVRLFNQAQVVGWRPPEQYEFQLSECLSQADSLVHCSRALVRIGGDVPCYVPDEDLIVMPYQDEFEGSSEFVQSEAYYAALFHELVRWTGVVWRLNRSFAERFGEEAEAMEALVAEVGGAFLCGDTEVSNPPRAEHAVHVSDWLRVLKGDRRAIFLAVQCATEAAAYLGSRAFDVRWRGA